MSDPIDAAGSVETASDPADVEAISSGSDGDGADTSDQEGTGADETSANDSTTDDASDEDILIKHLASGKLDELDDNGKKKAVPKAKAEEKPDAEESAETEKTEPEATEGKKPEDAKDPELSEEDAKELADLKPKNARERRKFASVLKERAIGRQAQKYSDDLIAHAKECGLPSTKDIHARFEEEKYLNSIAPDKRAEYYRKLADEISPAPKPVEIPEEMQGAIDGGFMSKEEAEALTRLRAEKAAPKPQKTQTPEPKPTPTGPTREAIDQGMDDIQESAKPYATRFGAEWASLAEEVRKELNPLLKGTDPANWKKLSQMVIESIVSKKQPALKKPSQTTRPAQAPPKKSSGIMTEEEEIEALAKGKFH